MVCLHPELSTRPRKAGLCSLPLQTGARMHQHEVNAANGEEGKRADTIRAIWEAGFQIVKAKIFETDDEQTAYAEERV